MLDRCTGRGWHCSSCESARLEATDSSRCVRVEVETIYQFFCRGKLTVNPMITIPVDQQFGNSGVILTWHHSFLGRAVANAPPCWSMPVDLQGEAKWCDLRPKHGAQKKVHAGCCFKNWTSEIYWHLLTSIDIYWHLLTSIDIYWHLLTSIDIYWHLLTSIDIYWHLLTSIDIYWHLLTSIDIYWHLLTSIDIWHLILSASLMYSQCSTTPMVRRHQRPLPPGARAVGNHGRCPLGWMVTAGADKILKVIFKQHQYRCLTIQCDIL